MVHMMSAKLTFYESFFLTNKNVKNGIIYNSTALK